MWRKACLETTTATLAPYLNKENKLNHLERHSTRTVKCNKHYLLQVMVTECLNILYSYMYAHSAVRNSNFSWWLHARLAHALSKIGEGLHIVATLQVTYRSCQSASRSTASPSACSATRPPPSRCPGNLSGASIRRALRRASGTWACPT